MDGCKYSGQVDTAGEIRLDRYIAEQLRLLRRSQIKARALQALVNGKEAKLSRIVKAGDMLELSWLPEAEEKLTPENIPLDILYEDQRVVVINKKAGMVVHPGAGNRSGTLANALLWRSLYLKGNLHRHTSPAGTGSSAPFPSLPFSASLRTGIVHRLDKDTSGLIIAAYDDEALAFLAARFKERKVRKRYAALVRGTPRETAGLIDRPITRDPADRKRFTAVPANGRPPGKAACTAYRVIKSWGEYSLLLCGPRTGRTHQIRVHLKSLGNPILGDPVYGIPDRRFPQASLMLHAWSLALTLPGKTENARFKAPLPERFKTMMAALDRIFPPSPGKP